MAKAGAALGGAAVEAGAAIGAGAMGALQAVMREAAAEARRASEATEEARRARGEAEAARRARPESREDGAAKRVYSSCVVLYREKGKKQVSTLAGKMRSFNCQVVLARKVPAHFSSALRQTA